MATRPEAFTVATRPGLAIPIAVLTAPEVVTTPEAAFTTALVPITRPLPAITVMPPLEATAPVFAVAATPIVPTTAAKTRLAVAFATGFLLLVLLLEGLRLELGFQSRELADLDVATQEMLDLAQRNHVLAAHEGDGLTTGAGTTGTADTVHVVLGHARQLIVDDMGKAGHINAAGRHVGGDQHLAFPLAQAVQCPGALALVHVAMQRIHGKAFALKFLGQLLGLPLGGGEDDGLTKAGVVQAGAQQLATVSRVVDIDHVVIDRRERLFAALDGQPLRILQQLVGQVANVVRDGGGEAHGLALGRQHFGNAEHILGEAHVQHPVGLVQHQHFQARQVDLAVFQLVDQTAGRGHQHFIRHGQCPCLMEVRGPPGDADGAGARQQPRQRVAGARDLLGQLAGGREHQHGGAEGRACRTATLAPLATVVLVIVARVMALGGTLLRVQRHALQGRQQEGCRLAGTGGRRGDQVVAGQQHRNGLRLHGRRMDDVQALKGLDQRLDQPQLGKARIGGFNEGVSMQRCRLIVLTHLVVVRIGVVRFVFVFVVVFVVFVVFVVVRIIIRLVEVLVILVGFVIIQVVFIVEVGILVRFVFIGKACLVVPIVGLVFGAGGGSGLRALRGLLCGRGILGRRHVFGGLSRHVLDGFVLLVVLLVLSHGHESEWQRHRRRGPCTQQTDAGHAGRTP